jgi:hypothetical protein
MELPWTFRSLLLMYAIPNTNNILWLLTHLISYALDKLLPWQS